MCFLALASAKIRLIFGLTKFFYEKVLKFCLYGLLNVWNVL